MQFLLIIMQCCTIVKPPNCYSLHGYALAFQHINLAFLVSSVTNKNYIRRMMLAPGKTSTTRPRRRVARRGTSRRGCEKNGAVDPPEWMPRIWTQKRSSATTEIGG